MRPDEKNKDAEVRARVKHEMREDLLNAYPNKTISQILVDLITKDLYAERQAHREPDKGFSTNFQLVGLIGYIPDYRVYDATDLIASASELYIHASPFSLFFHMYGHQFALINRVYDESRRTYVSINGQCQEGERTLSKWSPYHESDQGMCETLKRLSSVENSPFESYAIRGPIGLPDFLIAGDSFAISSIKTDQFTETESRLALVWGKPLIETRDSEYHWLIDNLGVKQAQWGIPLHMDAE